ncbi:MAG: type 4a pilus biogenesis protein PilO [Nitrospirae bacterium]|nr:type 4a pilus biogenesis protein PilO [Nitrospirota bacterium]
MINRRYLILALALALTVLGFERYFIQPRAEDVRDEIAKNSRALERDEQLLAGSALSEKGPSDAAGEMKKLEERLVSEKTEFLASARLQDEVSGMAEKAGLKLLTIRPMPAVKAGHFSNLPVYFEGSGNIRQISQFLRHIESAVVIIKVDKLGVNVTNMQNPRELKFKIQVSGLARI